LALDSITGTLAEGARVGLVGHNGAGKSTLLRLIAGIYEPCSGTAHIEGRVAPLFNISLGMDPEATGFENIVTRGLFLGLSRSEIQNKVAEIAAFTELDAFLDLPIRTYSEGMRTRLAFAVSTSIEPEILLLDEGIGAGDAAFLAKADKRLAEFTARAGIIVVASHSPGLIRRMCDKVVLLEHGRIALVGDTDAVLNDYQARTNAQGMRTSSAAVSGRATSAR
jgi:ABC-2 type transport system ATP-binding protein/lipopolysaccharide transport system ATP-binding protein